MADFKAKYARFTPDGRQDLPICSDMPGYIGKADLHGEAWHRRAGIIHARVDNPLEDNSPTVAGVKTDLLLYQFVDGKLFRISAWFATDLFHLVSEAVRQEIRPADQRNEAAARTDLGKQRLADQCSPAAPSTRGPHSSLHLVHKQLLAARRIADAQGLGRYLSRDAGHGMPGLSLCRPASDSRYTAPALRAARD